MNKIAKWKKVLFAIVAILVAIRIIYIGVRGEVDKEYYTSIAYDLSTVKEIPCQNLSEVFICNESRLNSLELIFNNIADDKLGVITLGIWNTDTLIYQTDITLYNVNNWEWKRVYVNAEMQKDTEYTITLNAGKGCTQVPTVFVVNNAASEIIASYSENDTMDERIAINFGYLRSPGVCDRLSIISLWVMFALLIFAILFYFERIENIIVKGCRHITKSVKQEVLIAVLEVLSGIIIINSSGIEFQSPTKVILYSVSLISVVQFKDKVLFVTGLVDKPVKKVFLYLLYVYAAFALVGQRLLIYPLTLKLTIANMFVFVVTILWFVPVVNTILYYLDIAWKYSFSNQVKIKTPVFITICTIILLLPASYNLFANNPGISSFDTVQSMITNAQHLNGMYDWHPAFYCMVLRVIQMVSNTTYAVIVVQYFFWAYVIVELLLFLRRKGMKESVLLCVAIFFGFNAGNFIQINTIWKDIPYTLSVLWVFIILAKLSIDYEEYKRKKYIYLEFIVSMVGVCLYRKNGIVSFVVVTMAAIIILRTNIKIWISSAITIILIFTIKGPIYDYFEVVDPGRCGIYIGLGQDVLGVYYGGGEISENTLEMITMMTDYNNAEYPYTPTWSYASYDVDVSPLQFIANYIDTFMKNPILMLRAVIDREDALWDIFVGRDSILGCVNYYETQDNRFQWNDYYPPRHYVSLYTTMSSATNYTASSQWISAIEWRCGLFTLLGMISVVFVIFRKGMKKYMLILSPLFGHIMSLLLSTGWSDFRYYWSINLMNTALILVVMVVMNQNAKGELMR